MSGRLAIPDVLNSSVILPKLYLLDDAILHGIRKLMHFSNFTIEVLRTQICSTWKLTLIAVVVRHDQNQSTYCNFRQTTIYS